MNREQMILATLIALFDLAQGDDPARADNLAGRIGATPTAVAEALLHLERRGLVDAGRARLTMRGLAAAAALRTHARRAHQLLAA